MLQKNKTKAKQNAIPGLTTVMMMITATGLPCLILGVVAGVIGLLHILQGDIHHS
jgi:hypothetical protein